MTTVAENCGGEVHELRGDGLLALFGAAITQEDNLWRRINAGSGGPGQTCGGQGLDLARTPWYTPGGQEHVFVSCWQIPPAGSHGGYPGSASGFDVVTGAGADRVLAAGSVPASLEELESAPTPLAGKQFGVVVGPGDVVHMHSGDGGGLATPCGGNPPM